ncbi:MAG: beta-ketoacyl synthase N-terminal-like domain-containing protein [Phycisphaerales bacterium]|nr:beta-ketoacyl synthase N-terminal-like domain-containing protein [Phycisphaerales bacterium]
MRSRVVITGLGPVCSAGVGIDALWQALQEEQSSISTIQNFDASGFRPKLAGEVRDVKIRDFVPKSYRKATKVMARDTELAVIAAKVAANDAGLTTRGSEDSDEGYEIDPHRTGCQIGAGLIAADTEELARAVVSAEDEQGQFSMEKWGTESQGESGMNNLPPLWLLKYLPNMLACHVTIIHGLEGPSNTIMGAEASAILSIGESARVIERGSADICFTGGAESRINPLGLLRWDYSGRLADTKNETDSSKITLPYHNKSSGGIIGEAGGMLVIECEESAKNRDAKIYAKIAGFGSAQSPSPMFAKLQSNTPAETSDRGLEAAIEAALRDAQIDPDQIDVIIPLGIGVPELDQLESNALSAIFDERVGEIPLVLPTHLIGNTMAAHGGIMTALGAKCLYTQCLPSYFTLNHDRSISTQHPSTEVEINTVLVCTSSLGGQAGALVLKR